MASTAPAGANTPWGSSEAAIKAWKLKLRLEREGTWFQEPINTLDYTLEGWFVWNFGKLGGQAPPHPHPVTIEEI